MKPYEDKVPPAAASREPGDTTTGLPWPQTWRGVYFLVLSSFALWVGLLITLTVIFS